MIDQGATGQLPHQRAVDRSLAGEAEAFQRVDEGEVHRPGRMNALARPDDQVGPGVFITAAALAAAATASQGVLLAHARASAGSGGPGRLTWARSTSGDRSTVGLAGAT